MAQSRTQASLLSHTALPSVAESNTPRFARATVRQARDIGVRLQSRTLRQHAWPTRLHKCSPEYAQQIELASGKICGRGPNKRYTVASRVLYRKVGTPSLQRERK